MSYCDSFDIRATAQDDTIAEGADAHLDDLADRASRIFDQACGVSSGFFEASEDDAEASERVFYGDGTNFLLVGTHQGTIVAADVSMPDGYTVPDFVERDKYLVLSSSTGILNSFYYGWYRECYGWPMGVPVTINKIWGYEAVPEDIKYACIELAINLLRETDPQSVKLTNIEGQPLREKLPPRVAMIAKKYSLSAGALA